MSSTCINEGRSKMDLRHSLCPRKPSHVNGLKKQTMTQNDQSQPLGLGLGTPLEPKRCCARTQHWARVMRSSPQQGVGLGYAARAHKVVDMSLLIGLMIIMGLC